MRKLIISFIIISLMSSCFCVNAQMPESPNYTSSLIWDMEEYTEGELKNQSDVWLFTDGPCELSKSDGRVIIKNTDSSLVIRFDQASSKCPDLAGTQAANAIAFYFENNTKEDCGISFFGEITNSAGTHQMMYTVTEFGDMECWLVDMTGAIKACEEYIDVNVGMGLAKIPAGFKGYYVVDYGSLGHDQCLYAEWGDHDRSVCQSGLFTEDSYFNNVGISIYSYMGDDSDYFVIDDYNLVTYTSETLCTPSPKPTKAPATQTPSPTKPLVTAMPTQGSLPTKSAEVTDDGDSVLLTCIVIAAAIAVAVCVTLIILKKKKT